MQGGRDMTRSRSKSEQQQREEINVCELKDINLRFPGDIYILAVWVAMSDRARSSPTQIHRTTVNRLARHYA